MRQSILIFCHGYATQFIDINNQYTSLFDPEKYDVTVAYLVGEPDEKVTQRHLAKHVLFLNSPKSSTRGLKLYAIKKMLTLHREKQFEIVICHRYKPAYIMMWVSQFKPIPSLFCVMHELKTMHHFTRKVAVRALAPKNMVFAGVSDAVRDDLRQSIWGIPEERIITFYNRIDTVKTEQALFDKTTARDALQLADDDFVFGNIGRLAKAKDQKTLIAAFANIKPECPKAKLIIMGTGDLEASLKKQINALNITHDVILTGFIHHAFKYAKALDVFILSSIKEAFGLVLLEAMIARIPIIATRVNGIPEVVGDAGILISPGEVDTLAQEMRALYHASPDRREQLGEKGYRRVTELFSFEQFKKVFWDVVEEFKMIPLHA